MEKPVSTSSLDAWRKCFLDINLSNCSGTVIAFSLQVQNTKVWKLYRIMMKIVPNASQKLLAFSQVYSYTIKCKNFNEFSKYYKHFIKKIQLFGTFQAFLPMCFQVISITIQQCTTANQLFS